MKTMFIVSLALASIVGSEIRAATIDDVTFLTRVDAYEAIVNTTLVTQEGKRFPIDKGTRVNVAGFTETEAFVISRTDRPNGFIRKADLAPAESSNPDYSWTEEKPSHNVNREASPCGRGQ